jgi:PhnB protein
MMTLNPYLIFDGNCEEAFRRYEQVLGGHLAMLLPFGDSPGCEDMPDAWRSKIMHARLDFGGQQLMASDRHPGFPYDGIKGSHIALTFDDVATAERVFHALAEGGTTQMPFGEAFWVERFGMLVDRFGAAWMINGGKPKL